MVEHSNPENIGDEDAIARAAGRFTQLLHLSPQTLQLMRAKGQFLKMAREQAGLNLSQAIQRTGLSRKEMIALEAGTLDIDDRPPGLLSMFSEAYQTPTLVDQFNVMFRPPDDNDIQPEPDFHTPA